MTETNIYFFMANYNINADLLKLGGAFVSNIKGKAEVKKCLCIPIEDAGLILGQKGCYLNLTAYESRNSSYGQTHYLKPVLPKEKFEAMAEDQRRAIPIVGNMKEYRPEVRQMPVTSVAEVVEEDDGKGDLPF